MNASRAVEPEQDARRCPRQQVSWLVTVAAGSRQFQGRTKDISASGAKILLKERPALGVEVGLRFRPPGRRPVETRALVWRLDSEGLACMFVGTQKPEFLEAVTPRVVPGTVRVPPPTPAGAALLATVDTGFRALALDTLGRSGYTVLDAGSQPLLALRIAEEHRDAITLILIASDLRLMNGEPLAKRLAPLLPSAKLVLMSSRSTPNPAGPGARWLPTPCTDGELMAQIRQAQA
ncbi:MAG TPA: PilZ domain-containing protein [Methylomirabilota bacterium]|nr:PilZ domain-containing protein [Methylomirabilota bacterium]